MYENHKNSILGCLGRAIDELASKAAQIIDVFRFVLTQFFLSSKYLLRNVMTKLHHIQNAERPQKSPTQKS